MEAFGPATDQREADGSANNTVSARNRKLEERGNHEPCGTAHCNETGLPSAFFGVDLKVTDTYVFTAGADLPSDARQPIMSSFSECSYTATSRMPFLIVSDTL